MNWPYWRFKVAAFGAFLTLYFYPLATYVRGEDAIFMWLLFGVPSLVTLLLPERASSIARGLAVGQSMVFGGIAGLAVITGVPVLLVSSGNGEEIAEFTLLLLGQSFLFWAAIRLSARPNGIVTWFTSGLAIAALVPAMIRVEDVRHHNMTPSAVYRVVACAESYADNHGGEYPESLQIMSQIPNCLYPFDETGHSDQGQIRFTPVRSGSGRVIGYSILFGPRTFFGKLKTAEYVDQTGIVHKPKDHPFATQSDPVRENDSTSLAVWSQCLLKYGQTHPGIPYPSTLADMLKPGWPCHRPVGFEKDDLIVRNDYTIQYKSPSQATPSNTASFSVQARPNSYRETGVRSYYVDESGIIRATVKNRPANKNDAPIPSCEWNVGTSCQTE